LPRGGGHESVEGGKGSASVMWQGRVVRLTEFDTIRAPEVEARQDHLAQAEARAKG